MALRLSVSYLFICICYDLSITHCNALSHCECTAILLLNYFLGSSGGQMRILKAGTLTPALGNFVTFAISSLYVPIHQTWGEDEDSGSEQPHSGQDSRSFSGRSGWEPRACPESTAQRRGLDSQFCFCFIPYRGLFV